MRHGPVAEERPAPSSRSDVGMQLRQDRRFADRSAAGRALAVELRRLFGTRRTDVVVLALPRGGAPVAVPVARSLHAPLDLLLVRKLGVPGQPELAMGAIAGVGGVLEVVRNDRVAAEAGVSAEQFDRVLADQVRELRDRERRYRRGPARPVAGRLVVLVDDGLATGSTMRAAVGALRQGGPAAVVVAVPVGAPSSCRSLAREVDRLICLRQPHDFRAVGQAYGDFSPTSDDEVTDALATAG
jgi:putative phosphoribosyl transferase